MQLPGRVASRFPTPGAQSGDPDGSEHRHGRPHEPAEVLQRVRGHESCRRVRGPRARANPVACALRPEFGGGGNPGPEVRDEVLRLGALVDRLGLAHAVGERLGGRVLLARRPGEGPSHARVLPHGPQQAGALIFTGWLLQLRRLPPLPLLGSRSARKRAHVAGCICQLRALACFGGGRKTASGCDCQASLENGHVVVLSMTRSEYSDCPRVGCVLNAV
mmetsp:Transcript_62637/g.203066  ORF Transcript_62637/g.203066 Transcript_62637/m.203066 type:complete len:219 (+) Transcript_62637:1015-1671(+)